MSSRTLSNASHVVATWLAFVLFPVPLSAGVGDPQLATDHPWYSGELDCSTFERLFATQATIFERVTGVKPTTDEQKALAAWLWRNTHYAHGEEGAEDLWGKGFTQGQDLRCREYWAGLFAHGFGLCGTTHSQWTAEFEKLLGHGRGRGVGTAGHNSFEAFLTGGAYGQGKWVLLDHDLSTIVFSEDGKALLSIAEVSRDWKKWTDRAFKPEKQHGWPVCGLHAGDASSFSAYKVAEYLAGYAGPPPMVHLRKGESLRRYFEPGLSDGKTFVFWGRNYRTGGIPGPERSITWVNQPERLFGSKQTAGYKAGQMRFGNAVFTYRPDFAGGYREAIVEESERHVVFEFQSPYVIAATPPNDKPWGIYDAGCTNGLLLRGKTTCAVSISTDRGRTWQDCGACRNGLDLTDRVKGRKQYWLKLHSGVNDLKDAALEVTTVCQLNPAILPRLKDGGSTVRFQASGRAVVSAGPNVPQAETHLVEGKFGSPRVTLELKPPRGEDVMEIHAAAHVNSSNPPDPKVRYRIEASQDAGKSWQPIVKDWSIPRRGDEPGDFWSQSMCWGLLSAKPQGSPVRVRFANDGGKAFARCEAHLVYRAPARDAVKVTFTWTDAGGERSHAHTVPANGDAKPWTVPTGKNVHMKWVEMRSD